MAAAGSIDALIRAYAAGLVEQIADRVTEQVAALLAAGTAQRVLDRKGLAEALNVSLPIVDRLRTEGMPELRVGDAPRFEFAAVLEWLKSRPAKGPAAVIAKVDVPLECIGCGAYPHEICLCGTGSRVEPVSGQELATGGAGAE